MRLHFYRKIIKKEGIKNMKESITDRYIGIGAGVGVALGFILKIALDSLAGLALGIFLGLFGGCMAALFKLAKRRRNNG